MVPRFVLVILMVALRRMFWLLKMTRYNCNFFVQNAQGQAVSSRWSSKRCIDYAVTKAPNCVQHLKYESEAISDHNTFCCTLEDEEQHASAPLHRLVRHDDLSMPEACTLDEWKYACTEFLSANPLPKPHVHCTQQAIDESWKQISDPFESMLRAAHSHFSNSFAKPRMSHKKGTLKFSKGFPPR